MITTHTPQRFTTAHQRYWPLLILVLVRLLKHLMKLIRWYLRGLLKPDIEDLVDLQGYDVDDVNTAEDNDSEQQFKTEWPPALLPTGQPGFY